ncbi:MAG: Rpn family recombination-promoting nuclease/putative transposase, partial [Acholeplasmatales bacterium]|nr:Rpn family recombination-promoting nuclease/putative transposase [Acholeplasmatales bacterium]
YYLYGGEEVIVNVKELDTKNVVNIPKTTARERDIFKEAIVKTSDENTYVLLGIENQTKVDYDMVIRNMIYDSFSYKNQRSLIEKKENNVKIRLKPVITLVIFYSDKEWTGPRDLYSMFEPFDEKLKEFVPNYKLNIIEPFKMAEEDLNKLDHNLAGLFELIKKSNNKDEFSESLFNKYQDLNPEIYELLNVVLNAGLEINESDGKINMCKAIDDMRKESKAEGIAEGKARGIAEGKANTIKENIKTMYKNGADEMTIAKLLSLDLCFVKEVLSA